jgi:hypothetical protein
MLSLMTVAIYILMYRDICMYKYIFLLVHKYIHTSTYIYEYICTYIYISDNNNVNDVRNMRIEIEE